MAVQPRPPLARLRARAPRPPVGLRPARRQRRGQPPVVARMPQVACPRAVARQPPVQLRPARHQRRGQTAGSPSNGASAPPTGTSAAGGATAGSDTAPPTDGPAWVVSVPDIALDALKISAEDRQMSPAVAMRLDDLSIHVTGFTTSHSTPVAVTISTKVNQSGKLDVKADSHARPLPA